MSQDWNFKFRKSEDGLIYCTIPSFEKFDFVKHCFTTRHGGVSQHPYKSLNLGIKTDDNNSDIVINYNKICDALNINIRDIVISDQVHGDKILKVSNKHKSEGNLSRGSIAEIDGLITNDRNIALITLYADCVPLFILDPVKKAIGLSHAGWRGTVKKIGNKTVMAMSEEFHSDPKDLIVGIAPSIGKCCYEVDDNILQEFQKEFENLDSIFFQKNNGKYLLDLWQANKAALLEAGVLEKNITISGICTKCNNDLFFSYRGENGSTGRMAAIIQLT